MDRLIFNGDVALSQADFFQVDHFTRVTGLTVSDVQTTLFFNNLTQPWTLTDGTGVSDIQVSSGKVYFNEVSGTPGYYSVRFLPGAVGYWRLVVTYPVGTQISSQDFDVVAQASGSSGIKASFVKPCL